MHKTRLFELKNGKLFEGGDPSPSGEGAPLPTLFGASIRAPTALD